MSQPVRSWADLYDRRAELFENPLDICEFYVGDRHTNDDWFRAAGDHISSAIQLSSTDNVLEIGCGCGVIMKSLMSRGGRFTGVDPARKVLAKAAESIPDASFFCASVDQLPFPNQTFDKAFSYQVFHYLGDLETASRGIQEIRRVVRPGGRIMIGQIPDASREADYQEHRKQRGFSRPEQIEHQLRWLWYPPEFFDQFRNDFQEVVIDQSVPEFDPIYRWRMDVLLTV
ncbi:MAG: class I SAM-dependent methyltransferase [Planctomyces sp.]|jgi:SAM-dependent methyltransferase